MSFTGETAVDIAYAKEFNNVRLYNISNVSYGETH